MKIETKFEKGQQVLTSHNDVLKWYEIRGLLYSSKEGDYEPVIEYQFKDDRGDYFYKSENECFKDIDELSEYLKLT